MPARIHLPVGAPRAATHAVSRTAAARLTGAVGLAVYNWWVVVPFTGWVTSLDGFFSDMSADGQPHAAWLQRLDVAAGLLLVLALLLRGPKGADGARRPEWPWLVAFASFSGVGGLFPYACAAGLDESCRALERGLQLPAHHYVHMVAGVGEFVSVTIAIVLAHRRTRGDDTVEAHLFGWLTRLLAVAYPLLGVAYFGDRLGAVIEPVFFVAFTAALVAELWEPREERMAEAYATSP